MTTERFYGYLLQQRDEPTTPRFIIFISRAKDIKQWAGIKRSEEHEGGTQRLLRESRVKQITRFLAADRINTIPNSVLLAFDQGTVNFTDESSSLEACRSSKEIWNKCEAQLKWGYIEFTHDKDLQEHEKPALIVDGQHRLHGMYEYENEDLPVIVVALLDASPEEQAFQFVVVNNIIVKVPTDNVKAIVADLDIENDDRLAERLLKAGVKYGETSPILRDLNDLESSPFFHLLDWPYNRNGQKIVQLTTIEQSLRFMRQMLPYLQEDEDSLLEIFMAMWRAVKYHHEKIWGQDEGQSRLMKKVSMNAYNEFLIERLKLASEFGLVDIFDPDKVEYQVKQIAERIPDEFWTSKWTIEKVQDNANVRNLIKQDLVTISENFSLRRAWSENLKLLDRDQLDRD